MAENYEGSHESVDVGAVDSKSKRTLYYALTSTLFFILYSFLVLGSVGKCFELEGSSNLGLTFTYDLQMVQSFFELRDQEQLACYSDFLKIWDIIYAVIYASMYSFWIKYLIDKKAMLFLVPILAMVADWGENFIEVVLINRYLESQSISETLVSLGSTINTAKWIFLCLTYLIILYGIATKVKSTFTSRKTDIELN